MIPKKISFISIYTAMGGGEYGLLHLMTNLDRSRYDPLLIVNEEGPLMERAKLAGIKTKVVPFRTVMLKHLIFPSNFWHNLKASFGLKKVLEGEGVEIVHCADVLTLLLLLPSLLTRKVRLVYSVIFFYEPSRAFLFNLLAPFFVSKIVCLSRMVVDDLKGKTTGLESKISCIYWGVDTGIFHPRSINEKVHLRKKYNLPLDKIVVGFIGRYDLWKGHHTFVDAAEILLAKRDDLLFLIVGGGMTENVIPAVAQYRRSVQDMISKSTKQSRFLVWDHSDDVPEIISLLDLFVCPSDSEPFGLVVLEAVASGIPAVVSETVGAIEILRGANGIFPAVHNNPETFASAIEVALQYSNLEPEGTRFDLSILNNYTWAQYARNYQDLYDSLRKTA